MNTSHLYALVINKRGIVTSSNVVDRQPEDVVKDEVVVIERFHVERLTVSVRGIIVRLQLASH